ncbi:type I restriction enzyme S subunit [Geobacillus thermodenitrificans]|jgi:type I restriction enzyme, S subunit|uniref:restriction endonuclease subunit S n=1 Tax=Geobacillus thermodenitrificans TaxID=33940 RepID=UPI002E032312|nr:restriction endonuclease subunit S [Geobacillus thermodenitrificans]MEC5186673.1 type I restriction enzyme S subunit [Geobacillus thermodenitrificans]
MSFRYVKLGSLFDITSGGTPSRKNKAYYENGDIPWVKTGDLKNMYLVDADEYITQQALNESSAKLFPKGTVLIAMYGATIGNCSILSINAATNQACAAFKPNNRIIPEFLYYYLTSIKEKLISLAVGGAQPNISISILRNIEIPLLTINQQERVVSILNKSKELIDKRKAQIEALDQLTQSVFLEMFGDPATNPKKWPMGFIKDLALKTQYGTSKKASEDTGKYPILRMNNITYQGHWDLTDLKYVDLDEKEVEKYLVHKGELLFNRTNSKELVGKTAVYRFEKPMAFAGYLVKVIPNEKANAEFISAYLNSKYGKSILFSMAKNIVGMANINAEELKSIKIYIPPKQLQDQFAEIVQKIESQRELFKKGLVELEKNFNSLMQRAFKGELFND